MVRRRVPAHTAVMQVFLVEDSPLVRDRLIALLGGLPDVELLGHASDAETAIREILGVPEGWEIAAFVPLGYPAKPMGKNRRPPVADFVFQDRWPAES